MRRAGRGAEAAQYSSLGVPMQVQITEAIVDALKTLKDVPDTMRKRFDGMTPAAGGTFTLTLSEDDAMALAELAQWHMRTDPATGKPTPGSAPFSALVKLLDEAQFS
jgi:hypothetical protein